MITRKKLLALLFTAICLLGILPLSVSAYTPAVEGAKYSYYGFEHEFPFEEFEGMDIPTTDIIGTMSYFACEGSPIEELNNSAVDILNGTITKIGCMENYDGWYVRFDGNFDVSAYVPELSPYPIYGDDLPASIAIMQTSVSTPDNLIAIISTEFGDIVLFIKTNISFTLDEILSTTNMSLLNSTLTAFATKLTTENYLDWMLDGYNSIIHVFVNNTKIQYVMDNPIFIIALVVFAMAISFAIATFIFKIFRRY